MKKILVSLSLIALLSGCEFLSSLSNIEYNNQVVTTINEITKQVEITAVLYNETIPTQVTEASEISTEEMSAELIKAKDLLESTDSLTELKSRNQEQQLEVEKMLVKYKSSVEEYFKAMDEMLLYYGNGEYKKDVTKVTPIDESIHLNYGTFIEANNTLMETLESFISED